MDFIKVRFKKDFDQDYSEFERAFDDMFRSMSPIFTLSQHWHPLFREPHCCKLTRTTLISPVYSWHSRAVRWAAPTILVGSNVALVPHNKRIRR